MNPLITSDLDMAAAEPESEFDEKQSEEVTNITPDETLVDSNSDGTTIVANATPRADDFDAMKKEYLEPPADLEVLDETINTWKITNWYNLGKKEHGPVFDCGGYPWRVLFFPYGNNQSECCSFYLEHGYDEKPSEDWYACLQFMLVLWNPSDPTIQARHIALHRFTADESDWGFTRFHELRRLVRGWTNDGRGMLDDDTANMTAFVRVIKDPTGVLWHSFVNYDSKKETGMVGLKNQGATCYLNSLLQSLYFTNAFRQAIYCIPTESETDARDNSAYALQRLFYLLQTSDAAVSTGELTTSFGWESRQIFEQQDVQELSRILMDKMEERMKGTKAEQALASLFVTKMKTYISCINVDYESSRIEDLWDIQLNVRGNATLDESFQDYIQVETMDGDNKYFAEGHGLQDAKKGVIFDTFPPVLHLQLKRFEYNFQADAMTKVYDRYEFPEIWDASPYLSETADRSESCIYHLHGVLVHSGDLNAGHYYAFLKPNKYGEFYKFDDDKVCRSTKKEAMEDNFGGDFSTQSNGMGAQQRNPYTRTWSRQKFMSAYMLVYIRESRYDSVLPSIEEKDTPEHLERKITEERAELERRRKERDEAHLYMHVITITDENFQNHQGFDLFPTNTSLLSPSHPSIPKNYRLLRNMKISEFRKFLAEELSVDEDLIRPWGLVNRQNGTLRPDGPLVVDDMTIEEGAVKLQSKLPLRVWIEVASRNAEGQPDFYDSNTLTDPKNATMPILLFLKYFDIEAQTLKGQGHLYVGKNQRISDLGPLILEKMGWNNTLNLKLYEEIKTNMIDAMNTKATLGGSELQHGDIVCFQKIIGDEELQAVEQAGKWTNPPTFYKYLHHRLEINFSEKNALDHDEAHFTLELSRIMNYDQVAAKVGEHLQVDPTHLRFSTVNMNNGRPRSYVKRNAVNQTLHSILSPQYTNYGHLTSIRNDWLFYEVLEMSLAELDTKKLVKIFFLSEGITKEDVYDILVPKNGVVADILPALQAKANLSDEDLANIRLYETHTNRVYKELHGEASVQNFNEWVTIYAEVKPREELEADQTSDRACYCFHYEREPNKTHGIPFKFVVKPDEKFSETKERLSKRTGIKGKLFEKIKFAVVSRTAFSRPDPVQDDDVLDEKLISSEDQLGLDHVNKSKPAWNKGDVMMIR